MRLKPLGLGTLVAVAWLSMPVLGQLRVRPLSDEAGETGLGLLLRRLSTVGIFMQTTAHPDDEFNPLLVMSAHGQGYRTILATATRGDGGQNEIGPELFDALGVLRTQELASMHRFDGAEQYFTRAVDFGFSVSLEETLEQWGREEITGDYVRLIRMLRPDVITGLQSTAAGLSHQHHPASAQIARDAYLAAGDPSRYPEQLTEGLRPWQAKKFYFTASGFDGRRSQSPLTSGFCQVETAIFDSLLGRTYSEIGTEARSMHKCQGMGQLLALPGPVNRRYQLAETTIADQKGKIEGSLFDGIDTKISALAQYARPTRAAVTDGLAVIARAVREAQALMQSGGPEAATSALALGLAQTRSLRRELPGMLGPTSVYEIDYRLALKEEDFQQALLMAHNVRIEALANDGVVVGGQPVTVTLIAGVHSKARVFVNHVAFFGFDSEGTCKPGPVQNGIYACESLLRIPATAKITAPYWRRLPNASRYEFERDAPFGLPFRPTPFRVRLNLSVSGTPITIEKPIEYRYEQMISGEKRMELHVVPALAVALAPEIAIVPSNGHNGSSATEREMRVTVTNGAKGAMTADVRLVVSAGWRVQPEHLPISFTREGEMQTARFFVRAPVNVAAGTYVVRATATAGDRSFDRGYQVVEYPHVSRRHLNVPATSSVKVLEATAAPNLSVGYVTGVGDQVPIAIAQLGATLSQIDSDELASGDLGKYDTIVLGVRAYEKREDLRAHNKRLLEYVQQGGTLIVQYNRADSDGEFNNAQYGPFPAKVSTNRVTDETAPVRLLIRDHPVFTYPNAIGPKTWTGWVQERGTYFLDPRDPRYVDLLEINEPFPNNSGVKRGALVEARVGRGRWIYVGLGLWRQLAGGTDGAYQLLANLISLGKAR